MEGCCRIWSVWKASTNVFHCAPGLAWGSDGRAGKFSGIQECGLLARSLPSSTTPGLTRTLCRGVSLPQPHCKGLGMGCFAIFLGGGCEQLEN